MKIMFFLIQSSYLLNVVRLYVKRMVKGKSAALKTDLTRADNQTIY